MQQAKTAQRTGIPLAVMAMVIMGCGSGSSTDPEPDTESGYTLSTEFLGDQNVLAANKLEDGSYLFSFGSNDNLQLSQRWKIMSAQDDYYRIHNDQAGLDLSLDVVNDGVFETLILAPTDNVSGQLWQVTELDNGYCRLTNQFLSTEIALDVTSDTASPTITMRSVDQVSGQHWQLDQVGAGVGPLDGKCVGP